MSLLDIDMELALQLQRAIDETKAYLSKGATTLAKDRIILDSNQDTSLNKMRSAELPKIQGLSKKTPSEIIDIFQYVKRAMHFQVGNCGEQSHLAALYLWKHFSDIERIEVVCGRDFDHVFLLINRPYNSKLNDRRTWGKSTYLLDPWSSSFHKMEDPDASLDALIAGGVEQTALMAQAKITHPWRLSKHTLAHIPQELIQRLDISPKTMPYPLKEGLFADESNGDTRMRHAKQLADELGRSDIRITPQKNTSNTVIKDSLILANSTDDFIARVEKCGSDERQVHTLIKPSLAARKHNINSFNIDEPSSKTGLSALATATYYGNATLVKTLLKHGANPHLLVSSWTFETSKDSIKTKKFDHYPLYLAAMQGHEEVFSLLWQSLNVEQKKQTMQTVNISNAEADPHIIIAAIQSKQPSILDLLLSDNDVTGTILTDDNFYHECLCSAIDTGEARSVQILLHSRASLPISSKPSDSDPFWLACTRGNQAVITMLVEIINNTDYITHQNHPINSIDQTRKTTPCQQALFTGLYEVAAMLIENFHSAMSTTTIKSLLYSSALGGNIEILDSLLEKTANRLNSQDWLDILDECIFQISGECKQRLIDAADFSKMSSEQKNRLLYNACYYGDNHLVDELLRHDADPAFKNTSAFQMLDGSSSPVSQSILQVTCFRGSTAVFESIWGALDENQKNQALEFGDQTKINPLLSLAIFAGNSQIIIRLLNEVFSREELKQQLEKSYILSLALDHGDPAITSLIIEKLQPSLSDQHCGETPLHRATRHNNTHNVLIMLKEQLRHPDKDILAIEDKNKDGYDVCTAAIFEAKDLALITTILDGCLEHMSEVTRQRVWDAIIEVESPELVDHFLNHASIEPGVYLAAENIIVALHYNSFELLSDLITHGAKLSELLTLYKDNWDEYIHYFQGNLMTAIQDGYEEIAIGLIEDCLLDVPKDEALKTKIEAVIEECFTPPPTCAKMAAVYQALQKSLLFHSTSNPMQEQKSPNLARPEKLSVEHYSMASNANRLTFFRINSTDIGKQHQTVDASVLPEPGQLF